VFGVTKPWIAGGTDTSSFSGEPEEDTSTSGSDKTHSEKSEFFTLKYRYFNLKTIGIREYPRVDASLNPNAFHNVIRLP
jgi:hypothetical protein